MESAPLPDTDLKYGPENFVAHRGYQKHYPENSRAGILAAIEAGAKYIELDIQFSRDHVPMLYHDDKLKRCSDQSGVIFDFDAEQLVQIPCHEPKRLGTQFSQETIQPISSLTTIAQTHPNITFYLELKEASIQYSGAEQCLKNIQQTMGQTLSQCCLISFDVAALHLAKSLHFPRLGPILRQWDTRQELAEALNAEVLFVNKSRLPAKGQIDAPCDTVVYEVEKYSEAQALFSRGASKIETFAIGEMIRAVSQETTEVC